MAMAYTQTLGIAMLFAALANLVVEVAPPDRTSEATGVLSVTRQFAASVGAQVIAFTLATSTVSVAVPLRRFPPTLRHAGHELPGARLHGGGRRDIDVAQAGRRPHRANAA
jgi:hypothetical protein